MKDWRAVHKNCSGRAAFTNDDAFVAIACAVAAGALFCLRLGVARGGLSQSLFLSMFVLPVALGITIFVEIPVLYVMRRWKRTGLLGYILVPGFTVLLLCFVALLASTGTTSVLKTHGRDLILDGQVVWGNTGWMLVDLEYIEPACWASLAGLAFWWIRVKNRRD